MADAFKDQMTTEIRPYGEAAIAQGAALLAAGMPVAVPTETVYGLAADARNASAVARIFAAKGRPDFNPLIVHVADLAAAQALGQFDPNALILADHFWPGPLTIVVPRTADCAVSSIATAGLDTIALRVPGHRAMQALLAASGTPLAAPSANASGRISPTSAAHVLSSLKGRIPLIIDDGVCAAGIESTIVRIGQGEVEVLRPGPVTQAMLASASGLPVSHWRGSAINAPGQMASHYAPSKPLRLHARDFAEGEFSIGFGPIAGDYQLSAVGDPVEAAARLFDALHAGDASSKACIAVAAIPQSDIGTAINDRLARAAA